MSQVDARPEFESPTALPLGTRLGEFEIRRVLGVGGFGIVYLAFDHTLEREVAIKEYMPSSLAGRTASLHVSLRSRSDADTFALGLRSFVNEARLLARFDHASLLKVYRFWEANGTAYMAMPAYRGRTLKDERASMAEPPDEAWLRRQLLPLLGALEALHGAGVYHRDIAPDNILLEADGQPVLLDFGAARRVIGDKSQTLTAILKPAYAPIEQYAEAGSVRQGPWTDLYALGATMHFMLLGRPPPPATARAVHDDQTPLAAQGLPGCSGEFLRAIDWMLAPRPADRPQSVKALREVLEGRAAAPMPDQRQPQPGGWERTQILSPSSVSKPTVDPTMPIDEPTVVVPPSRAPVTAAAHPAAPPLAPQPMPPAAATSTVADRPPADAQTRSHLPMAVLIGFGLVAIAAVIGYALWPSAPEATVAARSGASATGIATPPAPPSSATEVAAAPTPTPPASTVAPTPGEAVAVAAPAASAAVAAAAPKPSSPKTLPKPSPVVRPSSTPEVAALPPPHAANPAPHVAEAATAAAAAGLSSPSENCGKRVMFALLVCMERECRKPEFKKHPDCVEWRHEDNHGGVTN